MRAGTLPFSQYTARFTTRARLLAPLLDARATEQLLEETSTRLERLARSS